MHHTAAYCTTLHRRPEVCLPQAPFHMATAANTLQHPCTTLQQTTCGLGHVYRGRHCVWLRLAPVVEARWLLRIYTIDICVTSLLPERERHTQRHTHIQTLANTDTYTQQHRCDVALVCAHAQKWAVQFLYIVNSAASRLLAARISSCPKNMCLVAGGKTEKKKIEDSFVVFLYISTCCIELYSYYI